MSRSRKRSLLLCAGMIAAAGTFAHAAEPGHYGYGNTASPAQIAGWDIDARGDDGAGLSPGKGNVVRGSEVYAEQCAACHGTFGEGEGRFPKLAGGRGTLTQDRPELRWAVTGRLRRRSGTTLTAPCQCRRRIHCQPMTFML